ncbi:MAG TPA: nitrate reductase molybdenum cofactor assembly chaperone [Gaiellales bacterium]|nr:nitrate reductase molybdenum cofactor assembly chaperone [Gaiellales bacterium]
MSLRGTPPEVFEIASLLLRYPEADLLARDPDAAAAAAELPQRLRAPLERFLAHRRETPGIDLEREYVETFDTRRRCTLNVSYYLYGDTRRRGVALLRLKRMYAAAGLALEADELPDHLPVMLGFAALAPPGYGEHVLQEHRIGVELLLLSLRDAGRPHADVLEAVSAALPRLGISQSRAVRRLAAEGPPDEQVGLEPFAPPEVMPLEVRQ